MYLAIEPQPTNAQAWIAAATAVQDHDGEAYNVIIDIKDPLAETNSDVEIINTVDEFLRDHNAHSLSSLANTIFPQATLERHCPEKFYDVYRDRVFPRIKKMTRDWGRYFDRLTRWTKIKGGETSVINPLDDLIKFMNAQINSNRTYRNVYEMTVFDPAR